MDSEKSTFSQYSLRRPVQELLSGQPSRHIFMTAGQTLSALRFSLRVSMYVVQTGRLSMMEST